MAPLPWPMLAPLLLLAAGPRRAGAGEGTAAAEQCHSSRHVTWCESRSLDALPAGLPNSTKELCIRFSRIRELTPEVAADVGNLRKLKVLEMTTGALEAVTEGALLQFAKLRKVDLSRNRISELSPRAFPKSVRELLMPDNQLQDPVNRSLVEAPLLEQLAVDRCGLSELSPAAMRGLPRLKDLSAAGNALTALDPSALAACPRLLSLTLDDNPLQAPPEGPLLHSQSLTSLSLGNTSLASLNPHLFCGLPSLEKLMLNDNGIEALPEDIFSGMQRLHFLDLSSNQLTALSASLQRPPTALRRLFLRGNRLGPALPDGPLLISDDLRWLELSDNGLEQFSLASVAALPALELLALSRNPQLRVNASELEATQPQLEVLKLSDTASACPCLDPALADWDRRKGGWFLFAKCDGQLPPACDESS